MSLAGFGWELRVPLEGRQPLHSAASSCGRAPWNGDTAQPQQCSPQQGGEGEAGDRGRAGIPGWGGGSELPDARGAAEELATGRGSAEPRWAGLQGAGGSAGSGGWLRGTGLWQPHAAGSGMLAWQGSRWRWPGTSSASTPRLPGRGAAQPAGQRARGTQALPSEIKPCKNLKIGGRKGTEMMRRLESPGQFQVLAVQPKIVSGSGSKAAAMRTCYCSFTVVAYMP